MNTAELFGDPDQWPDDDLVAVTGVLGPHLVLAALHEGVFPMPLGRDVPRALRGGTGWWSPVRRGVLPIDRLRVARSLRKTCRRYTTTVDQCFDEVVSCCGDPGRPGGWIDWSIRATYGGLHRDGWAHSVETWDDDGRLVGGLYGVCVGGLFSGESMFHDAEHGRDASKTALMRLVVEMSTVRPALVDVQWLTPHLASLGAVEISRQEYLGRLDELVTASTPGWGPRTMSGAQLLAAPER